MKLRIFRLHPCSMDLYPVLCQCTNSLEVLDFFVNSINYICSIIYKKKTIQAARLSKAPADLLRSPREGISTPNQHCLCVAHVSGMGWKINVFGDTRNGNYLLPFQVPVASQEYIFCN